MRIPGFEPGQVAWEATIIPLDHTRIFHVNNILRIFNGNITHFIFLYNKSIRYKFVKNYYTILDSYSYQLFLKNFNELKCI